MASLFHHQCGITFHDQHAVLVMTKRAVTFYHQRDLQSGTEDAEIKVTLLLRTQSPKNVPSAKAGIGHNNNHNNHHHNNRKFIERFRRQRKTYNA